MPPFLFPLGRTFYALGLIGIGVQHFIFTDFIPVILPVNGRPWMAYLVGSALAAAGIAILLDIGRRTVAIVTGAFLLLFVAAVHVPVQLRNSPAQLAVWSNAFKALSLAGGAFIVADSFKAGRFFLPITMVVFGIEHFLYPKFVAMLIPAWIPGKVFWTYFAGIALIAAGLAMITRIQAKLASLLLGIMIFLWFVFLHIPRAIADPHSGKGNEWTSVFEALAFSGIAFMMAAREPQATPGNVN